MLVLDTHVLIWLVEDSDRLGPRTARLADRARADGDIGVASISFWEVAMLAQRRRILLDLPVSTWRLRVLEIGIQEVPLTGDVAIAAVGLASLHPDPADRLIVATSLSLEGVLATADDRLLGWPGELRRHDARR